MSKELEALKRMEYFVNEEMGIKTFKQSGWHIEGTDDYEMVKEALQRLEAIDSAKPSKALESLKKLGEYELKQNCLVEDLIVYDTIKQALIKVQESKKYLKWEDLEFKPYTMKVKMGDNLYMLNWSYSNNDDYDDSKSVTLRTLNGDWLFTLEKYFFNDLHLEVVEDE